MLFCLYREYFTTIISSVEFEIKMMEQGEKMTIKKWIIDHRKSLISLGILYVFIGVVSAIAFHLDSLSAPIFYNNGDVVINLQGFASADRGGSLFFNDRLAAPFDGADYGVQTSLCGDFVSNIIAWFIMLFTDDEIVCLNLVILIAPFLSATSAYICLRKMKVSEFSSVLAAATFALCTFYFKRLGHTVLLYTFPIPIVALICYWIYTDSDFLVINKDFFKYKRNIIALCLCFLVAGASLFYYQFFSCFFILVIGIAAAVREHSPRYILKSAVMVCGVLFCLLIYMLPYIISVLQNGSVENQVRSFSEAEVYALQIIQLFMPINSHGIGLLEDLRGKFYGQAYFVNENETAYLGIWGIIGFIFLLVYLFAKKDNKSDKRLEMLSILNIFGILLGTFGGFSAIFSLVISSKIRGYNRISVFLVFFCCTAVSIAVDYLNEKIKSVKIRYVAAVGVSAFAIISVMEQIPEAYFGDFKQSSINALNSNRSFYSMVEETYSDTEEAMIYQMPFCKYPEGGSYDQIVGSIFSDKLRWSGGALENTMESNWSKNESEKPIETQLEDAAILGFDGVCVYKNVIRDDAKFSRMIDEVGSLTGAQPAMKDDGSIAFFDIREYAQRVIGSLSENELALKQQTLLNIYVEWSDGFYSYEESETDSWHWCSSTGRLMVNCESEAAEQTMIMSFTPATQYTEYYNLTIGINGNEYKYEVNCFSQEIQLPVEIKRGENIITFSTDAPKVNNGDPRTLCVRLYNFSLKNADTNNSDSEEPLEKIACEWNGGFYGLETYGGQDFRWCSESGSLYLTNCTTDEVEATLVFSPTTLYSEPYTLTVSIYGSTYEYEMKNEQAQQSITVNLKPGETIVDFSTDAPPLEVDDPRTLCFRIWDFEVDTAT